MEEARLATACALKLPLSSHSAAILVKHNVLNDPAINASIHRRLVPIAKPLTNPVDSSECCAIILGDHDVVTEYSKALSEILINPSGCVRVNELDCQISSHGASTSHLAHVSSCELTKAWHYLAGKAHHRHLQDAAVASRCCQ